MVSEGTDIPRLRVCSHLSLIRTELFFRQVLGRVLRLIPGIDNQKGWLFSFAEPSLVEYAKRLQQDIPDNVFKIEKVGELNSSKALKSSENYRQSNGNTNLNSGSEGCWHYPQTKTVVTKPEFAQQMLSFRLQGQYRQQVFSIF